MSAMRFVKFNAVGAVGIAVQLAVLALLAHAARLNYMLATALAVEAAVLHNFMWHERFTWADRRGGGVRWRLLRFNTSVGAVSIGGNLLLMRFFVGYARLPVVLANLLSIAGCGVLNYFVNDKWVFRETVKLRGTGVQPPMIFARTK